MTATLTGYARRSANKQDLATQRLVVNHSGR
jgi:hypothetical protein